MKEAPPAVTVRVNGEPAPDPFEATNVAVPAALVKFTLGFCEVLELTAAPVNVHAHDVGELVDVSVNVTTTGAVPEVGDQVKLDTGTAGAPPLGTRRA